MDMNGSFVQTCQNDFNSNNFPTVLSNEQCVTYNTKISKSFIHYSLPTSNP